MEQISTFARGIQVTLITFAALLQGCTNNNFDLTKIKTDNVTLFGDSLIIPLGSTKTIPMNEILTDEVLKDLGMQKDEEGYSFSFKNNEEINLDFNLSNDIAFDAPALPSSKLVETNFGSFSLNNLNMNTQTSATIVRGQIAVNGTGTDPSTYTFRYNSHASPAALQARSGLSLPRIGQSSNQLNGVSTNAINIDVAYGTIVGSHNIDLSENIPIQKLFSVRINNTTGGLLSVSLDNTNSSQSIKSLGCDYSKLRAIFPKEFEVSGSGITFDSNLKRQVKFFSADGTLSAILSRVSYGTEGLNVNPSGPTEIAFDLGYDGIIEIRRPQNMQEISALATDSNVELNAKGSISNSNITAVSAQIKERTETLNIDNTEINLGSVEVPSMVKSLTSISIQPVKINLNVGKLNITGLSSLPPVGGKLMLELPDFCRIDGRSIGADGKWEYAFSDLCNNGFSIPLVIDRITNLPPINNGKMTFDSKLIKVSGTVAIPSFTVSDISTITSSAIELSTTYGSGISNGKMHLAQIEGVVESQGSYKIELNMLKELREGKGEQGVKLENISFNNPNFALNFNHTLPANFKAQIILTPYIADKVKGTPVNLATEMKAGTNQTTIVNNVSTEQINGLISQLPDSIVLNYVVHAGELNEPAVMNMTDIKGIKFGALYHVGLPLSFGPDMKITTEGKTELNLGQNFIDMLFGTERSQLTLMATAENSIPMNLSVQFIPLDKDNNPIPGITLSSFIVKGGTIVNDIPTPTVSKFNIEIKGNKEALAKLAKLNYVVSASPSEAKGATLRPDCSLKMGLSLKLLGGIQVKL